MATAGFDMSGNRSKQQAFVVQAVKEAAAIVD
jgi:hypothetical protein